MKPTSTTATPDISDEAPKLTQDDFDRARFRLGERPITRSEWQLAVQARTRQLAIELLLDEPIIEHFKAIAGERDFRPLINETLRRAIESEHLETNLRRIIREELAGRG